MGRRYELIKEFFKINLNKLYFLLQLDLSDFTAIGDVVSGRADVTALSSVTLDWKDLVSFVGPMGLKEIRFVTSIPALKLGNMGFFFPFCADVLGYLIISFLIVTSLMYYAMKIYMCNTGSSEVEKTEIFIDAVMITWGLTLDQDVGEERGTRYISLLWIAFILVMGTGYKSNLAAFMSFPSSEVKPQNFQQLDISKEYTIYFENSAGAAWFYLESSDNPMISGLKRRMVPVDLSKCVISAFMESKAACVIWSVKIRPAEMKYLSVAQVPTTLITSADSIWDLGLHMAIEKHSRFKDALQFIAMSCYESGLVSHWIENMLPQYRKEGLEWLNSQKTTKLRDRLRMFGEEYLKKDEAKVLQVENVEIVFLVWGVGLLMAISWFGVEFGWRRNTIRTFVSYLA